MRRENVTAKYDVVLVSSPFSTHNCDDPMHHPEEVHESQRCHLGLAASAESPIAGPKVHQSRGDGVKRKKKFRSLKLGGYVQPALAS